MVDFRKALIQCRQGRKLTDNDIEGVFNMADKAKLSRLSAMWVKAVPITPSFSNITDGDYVADIKEMKLSESKAGNMQVVTTIEVADAQDPEIIGQTGKRFDRLEDEEGRGMGYFKNLCEVIGLDLPEDLNQWQEAMDAFVGNSERIDLYDITVKTLTGKNNRDYTNIFINGISEFTKGEEVVEEEVEQEEVEQEVVEEVVEEEVQQEVVAPVKRRAIAAAKPAVGAIPVKKVAQSVAQPTRVAAKATVVAAGPKAVAPVRRVVRK